MLLLLRWKGGLLSDLRRHLEVLIHDWLAVVIHRYIIWIVLLV